MLKSVFMHDPYVQFIGMMKSLINNQLLVPGQSRAEAAFKRIQVLERGVTGDQLPSLWVADRKDHKELAVGVMCLNTQINYEELEESFELSPFSGLKHIDTPPNPKPTEFDSGSSVFTTVGNIESRRNSNAEMIPAKDVKSRVTWLFDDDELKEIPKESETKSRAQELPYSQLDILNLLEDEEDELEYDIVNIDTDLLRLPRLFTSDDFLKKRRFSGELAHHRKESVFKNKYIIKDMPKELSNASVNIAGASLKPPELTRYLGRPNAFLLEMFAMHPDYDERDVRVRKAETYDIPHLNNVLEHAPRKHNLLGLLEKSLQSLTLSSFVLLSQNQPIGVAILGPLEDATSIRTQYELEAEPIRSGTDASVRAIPFALWTIERPLTSLPKVHVNNSIVVVGASRTGLAFLETLLLGPTSEYLTFTNLTLVSQHGLPAAGDGARAADACVPRDGRYTDRYLKRVPFYYYVDIISAIMVKIDRKKKCIHLNGSGIKYYDELILTCGQQFQHPDYLKDAIELAKEIEKGKPCDRVLMDNPKYRPDSVPLPPDLPDNVMLINNLYEANVCLRRLTRMISDAKQTDRCLSSENKVVVYGDFIEAYSCIAALLELGISAENIAFVEPFPPDDSTAMRVNCFNNETVDERVQASIEKLGIKTYKQCYFHGWSLQGSRVEFLRLMSPLHALHLPCFALFYYGIKAIDLNAFKAINESGLVYDGGLVVGPQFETNDPCVFGAGPCTKYSRRLHAPQHSHKYYYSEDVGEALAKLLLRKMDPFVNEEAPINVASDIMLRYNSSLLARWQPVMKFSSPLVRSATLPGPLYYMNLRRPGKEVPMAVQLLLPNQVNLVSDLYEYFMQPWMAALYQEPFGTLLYDIYEQAGNTVYDVIKTKYNEFYAKSKIEGSFQEPLSEAFISHESGCEECGQNEELRHDAATFWKAVGGENIVYANLTRFLNKNVITNPQYAIPEQELL
ncbi:unnamed protein product, partial [Brenthis ino]